MSSRGWDQVTAAEAAAMGRKQPYTAPTKSKYRNIRTMTPDGHKFDSRREADYGVGLRAREANGAERGPQREGRGWWEGRGRGTIGAGAGRAWGLSRAVELVCFGPGLPGRCAGFLKQRLARDWRAARRACGCFIASYA